MVPTHGYTTDILSQRAVTFLERRHTQPFFLWLAHKAVHPELVQRDDGSIRRSQRRQIHSGRSAQIAVRRTSRCRGVPMRVRRPNDKPALERKIGNLPPLGPATGTDDETIRNRLRMLKAVDEGVGQMLHGAGEERPTRQHGVHLHQR